MQSSLTVRRLRHPYRVVIRALHIVMSIQSDETLNQRIQDRHLLEIEQTIQVAAEIQSTFEYQARVLVLVGGEIRCSQTVQRSQQRAVGASPGVLNDLHGPQKSRFGRLEVMQPILSGGEIAQRNGQRAVGGAVLPVGHR